LFSFLKNLQAFSKTIVAWTYIFFSTILLVRVFRIFIVIIFTNQLSTILSYWSLSSNNKILSCKNGTQNEKVKTLSFAANICVNYVATGTTFRVILLLGVALSMWNSLTLSLSLLLLSQVAEHSLYIVRNM